MLLHGNQCAARGGGVSPQLIGRLNAVIGAVERGQVDHVYFFAKDVYPNGERAVDFVHERLTRVGLREKQLTIHPEATDTRGEVMAFVRHRARNGHRGPVWVVTSFYHAPRCKLMMEREGCRVYELVTVPQFGVRDLVLEPIKFFLDGSRFGQHIKRRLKPSRQQQIV